MAITAEQFAKALVTSGLMKAGEVQELWRQLPATDRPKDAAALAALLVEKGLLTDFQTREILAGQAAGLVLGDYVVLDKIGAGGMGQVFKARHRHMERVVAIKLLPPAMTKDENAVKRFQREVVAAARLSHPNIVAALDARNERGTWYLVMEYVAGRDLGAVVKERGPLPVDEALHYIWQAACGLAYAHENGVVHRDIKPANLLLEPKGTVKILDLGLARFDDQAAESEGLTQSGQVMGTVDYMAPEQAVDTRHADARADIYSLGCSLYRLLVAENMYAGDSLIQKLLAHREAPLPDLQAKRADVSPQLAAVFQRMVAKMPEERYQTMNEVVAALDSCRAMTASGSTTGLCSTDVTAAWNPSQEDAAEFGGGDMTISGLNAEVETDPKSERFIPKDSHAVSARARRAKKPPWRRAPGVLIGGGAAAFLVIALSVWIVIKNEKAEVVNRGDVPDEPSLEPLAAKTVAANPQVEAAGPPKPLAAPFDAAAAHAGRKPGPSI